LSKILKESIQGAQLWNELKPLHPNLKSVKLIYQASRDDYDATKLANAAKNYSYTLSVIQSNHGKTFGAYTAIPFLLGDRIWKKNIEGRRSFTYFFEKLNLRVCRPRKDKIPIDKMFFG